MSESTDQFLDRQENSEAREDSIKLLAEQLSCSASFGISQALMASSYDFKYKDVNNNTNGSDEFNELFYSIAEKLIDSVG